MSVRLGSTLDDKRYRAHREAMAALSRCSRGERRHPWWVRMLERIWGVAA